MYLSSLNTFLSLGICQLIQFNGVEQWFSNHLHQFGLEATIFTLLSSPQVKVLLAGDPAGQHSGDIISETTGPRAHEKVTTSKV